MSKYKQAKNTVRRVQRATGRTLQDFRPWSSPPFGLEARNAYAVSRRAATWSMNRRLTDYVNELLRLHHKGLYNE
eukprot:807495-Pleurochrysis_carterae.AAC.1